MHRVLLLYVSGMEIVSDILVKIDPNGPVKAQHACLAAWFASLVQYHIQQQHSSSVYVQKKAHTLRLLFNLSTRIPGTW